MKKEARRNRRLASRRGRAGPLKSARLRLASFARATRAARGAARHRYYVAGRGPGVV